MISVPMITAEMSTLDAALAYARAGFYVGPAERATKDPGSVIGSRWQRYTSRDPKVIASWFAGSDHGVFLHAGRSGCVIFDVDDPDKLHPAIRQAIEQSRPPYQSTRPNHARRGHYLFGQPEGRNIGNSLGRLAGGWGEIRGLNGVIIVAPSEHAAGGVYRWQQTGAVPVLPGYLASQLPDALEAAETATDKDVTAFLAGHVSRTRPDLLDIHAAVYSRKIAVGESRHDTMTGHLAGAMKEAAAGLLHAKEAADTLESVFLAAAAQPPVGPKQGKARTGAVARNEWRGLLAWAVAQGRAADPTETLLRIAEKVPAQFSDLVGDFGAVELRPEQTGEDSSDHMAGGQDPDDPVEPDSTAAIRERLPRLDLAQLLSPDRPAREWLWWRLIPAGAAVALVGAAGAGKSLLLLALMIAVARGDRAFAGLRITSRRVFLVDMENTEDDLADRFRDLGITPADAAKLNNLVIIHLPMLAPLDTAAGGRELAAALDAYQIRAGDVVVLDSFQRVTTGKENESDTTRAYYLHTGMMLKRRGLTVVRTDNTGKDTEKGARGSSGKRDDVDVELILTPDAGHPGRVTLKPGKLRLPDVDSILLDRQVDDDGRLHYTTAGDPFRAKISDAIAALDRHAIPLDTGEKKAAQLLKDLGETIVRAALRVAIKERRDLAKGAPTPNGAPLWETEHLAYADPQRRTTAHPPESGESERETYADTQRRSNGATSSVAPQTGAPPLALSIESGAPGAQSIENPPPVLFAGSDICAECGDPLSSPGLLSRCRDWHKASDRLSADLRSA